MTALTQWVVLLYGLYQGKILLFDMITALVFLQAGAGVLQDSLLALDISGLVKNGRDAKPARVSLQYKRSYVDVVTRKLLRTVVASGVHAYVF